MTATVSTTTTAQLASLTLNSSSPAKDTTQPPSACSSSSPSHRSNSATQPRLLYRGALSLPDSHLLLDGLTFTITLPADDPHASRALLESPLTLALESLRGRPSLSFRGFVKMENIHCDFSERVNLHVHPRSILTRQLFEYTLCVTPVSPSKVYTDSGIRIGLGDASNSTSNANNDIVVFGRPHPSSSIMQLCVARIMPPPPKPTQAGQPLNEKTQQARPPRPDDPIPRKPPAGYAGIARIGLGMKRTASVKLNGVEGPNKKLKKEAPSTSFATSRSQGSFKIPPLPPGKARATSEVDVFFARMEVDGLTSSGTQEHEAQNKMFIKKAVVRLMGAAGVSKTNPSFKDFFNQVYHGTSFALRAKMGIAKLEGNATDSELVDRIVQAHITLYLGGLGVGVMLLQQG
ncbi:hypothetical protein A7U60_g4755 [Sanghuangporus baumii]|uniref:Sld7 C-terminal domain-containing protein n=1 Tax=Sanghuangporus baumii TaxID=108892 RepID=A0A9Q5N4Q5_SANBA|nr:hypothetical protein A7U60_g4755 [Sanghuangporus baumii]